MTTLNISPQELDALIQEGLDSGLPTPMTMQDWAEIRLEVQRRDAEKRQALDKKLSDGERNVTH